MRVDICVQSPRMGHFHWNCWVIRLLCVSPFRKLLSSFPKLPGHFMFLSAVITRFNFSTSSPTLTILLPLQWFLLSSFFFSFYFTFLVSFQTKFISSFFLFNFFPLNLFSSYAFRVCFSRSYPILNCILNKLYNYKNIHFPTEK